jgi:lipoprotein NlpI
LSGGLALAAAAPRTAAVNPAPTNLPPISVVDALMDQAQIKQLRGETNAALDLATKAVEMDPTNAQCFYVRGRLYAARHDSFQALGDFNRALELEPRGGEIYQLRGFEKFKIGQYQSAIADFDRFLKFAPKEEPYHWHRGIAFYFAGRFEEGRKQFEMRQQLGTNTIENAFWHFLCSARLEGVEKARASMMPFQDDSPTLAMRKIYDLFAGKAKPEDVLASAQANYASSQQLHRQLFFANFYLGFYCELLGDNDSALAYATKASANDLKPNNFMGDVAVAHAEALKKK